MIIVLLLFGYFLGCCSCLFRRWDTFKFCCWLIIPHCDLILVGLLGFGFLTTLGPTWLLLWTQELEVVPSGTKKTELL